MEYEELSRLFHMGSAADRYARLSEQADYRRFMPSSFDIGIDTPNGRLFVAMPREMLVLYERVLRTERKVSSMMRSIPGIAQAALTRSLVLDEVVSTNAIEDIHSTRKQVKDALDASSGDSTHLRRFRELARLYLELGNSQHDMPSSPQDIRNIYDKAVQGEIPEDKLPDGVLFRADGVEVTAGGIRVVHTGLESESKIKEAIESMLGLISRDDVPQVISAIASHYVFEYAHPFYDGNGRTGRYLLSLFLSEALSAPTVLSLSRSIAESRDVYYRAFKSAENPLNKGELTFFVHAMLALVERAQTGIIDGIEKSKASLDVVAGNMDALTSKYDLSEKESCILFAMAQYELFGMFGASDLHDISAGIELGKQMTRKHVARLESRGLVSKVSQRPLLFSLPDGIKESLGM